MPLPAEIKRLMTQKISWRRYNSADSHADEIYDPAVELDCWVEEKGGSGGIQAKRGPMGTILDPLLDVYFDAADSRVKRFSMRDQFQAPGIAGGQLTHPDRLNTFYGPPAVGVGSSSGEPWAVVVTL